MANLLYVLHDANIPIFGLAISYGTGGMQITAEQFEAIRREIEREA